MTLINRFRDSDEDPATAKERFCPVCKKNESEANKLKGFGGFWRLLCSCGHQFDAGRDEQ